MDYTAATASPSRYAIVNNRLSKASPPPPPPPPSETTRGEAGSDESDRRTATKIKRRSLTGDIMASAAHKYSRSTDHSREHDAVHWETDREREKRGKREKREKRARAKEEKKRERERADDHDQEFGGHGVRIASDGHRERDHASPLHTPPPQQQPQQQQQQHHHHHQQQQQQQQHHHQQQHHQHQQQQQQQQQQLNHHHRPYPAAAVVEIPPPEPPKHVPSVPPAAPPATSRKATTTTTTTITAPPPVTPRPSPPPSSTASSPDSKVTATTALSQPASAASRATAAGASTASGATTSPPSTTVATATRPSSPKKPQPQPDAPKQQHQQLQVAPAQSVERSQPPVPPNTPSSNVHAHYHHRSTDSIDSMKTVRGGVSSSNPSSSRSSPVSKQSVSTLYPDSSSSPRQSRQEPMVLDATSTAPPSSWYPPPPPPPQTTFPRTRTKRPHSFSSKAIIGYKAPIEEDQPTPRGKTPTSHRRASISNPPAYPPYPNYQSYEYPPPYQNMYASSGYSYENAYYPQPPADPRYMEQRPARKSRRRSSGAAAGYYDGAMVKVRGEDSDSEVEEVELTSWHSRSRSVSASRSSIKSTVVEDVPEEPMHPHHDDDDDDHHHHHDHHHHDFYKSHKKRQLEESALHLSDDNCDAEGAGADTDMITALSPRPPSPPRISDETGYPFLARTVGEKQQFQIYRRFTTLNHRILLHMQDEITELSEALDKIDSMPESGVRNRRGMYSTPVGEQRLQLLGAIAWKLQNYNQAVKAYQDTLTLATPESDALSAYSDFLSANKPVAEVEACYLADAKDLMQFPPSRTASPPVAVAPSVQPLQPPQSRPPPPSRTPSSSLLSRLRTPPVLSAQTLQALTIIAIFLSPYVLPESAKCCCKKDDQPQQWNYWMLALRAVMWVVALTPAVIGVMDGKKGVMPFLVLVVGLGCGLGVVSLTA